MLTDPVSLSGCKGFLRYLAICVLVYCNWLVSRLWRHKFDVDLNFLIKLFFYMNKVRIKIEISQEQKELLRWNKKHSSILKDFHLPEISDTIEPWSFPLLDIGFLLFVRIRSSTYSVPWNNYSYKTNSACWSLKSTNLLLWFFIYKHIYIYIKFI